MQIVQMGLCDINNSPGGVLEPHSVTRAKNHKVSAQALGMYGRRPRHGAQQLSKEG